MDINYKSKLNPVRYDALEYGDVFEVYGDIFMKLVEDEDSEINTVNLSTNQLEIFCPHDMVKKLDAKLVIE